MKKYDPSPWFVNSFKKFHKKDPSISARLKEFKQYKNNNTSLPSNFNDHSLLPPFNGTVYECHLSSDILLIYKESSATIWLLEVVDHQRIVRGSKAESDLANRHN